MRTDRPLGFFETLSEGKGFKVKKIVVNSGCRLSLQKHEHRSEHWTIVSGDVIVWIGPSKKEYKPDQACYIPKGEVHRIENKSKAMVEIIEVQCGDILSEEDIVRIEDDYSRS